MKYVLVLLLSFLSLSLGLTAVLGQARYRMTKDAEKVAHDNNQFALDLYQQLRGEDGNLFFSPYSISTALAMTYAGARGNTETQMAKTLHFSLPQQRFHPAFGELVHYFNDKSKKRPYQLSVANRLWAQQDYAFKPAFLKLTQDRYGAGVKELDFVNNTELARQTINAWVEKETNDKIKNLIQKGILDRDTRLVLTNAIYFKSAWSHVFHKSATKDENFTLATGKAKVPMMRKHEAMAYAEGEDFKAVQIPYKGHALSMMVLLPNKANGLADLEKSLTAKHLDQLLQKMQRYQVDLKLPRFKYTSQFKLKDTLSKMGMPVAFSNNANFSGMSTQERLKITQVVHKAFVDANEKGTEAAAATAVIVGRTSAIVNPRRATFHADHPFLFLIRENRTGSILFMGRVMNPGS